MKCKILSAVLCLFILLSAVSLTGCDESPVCLPEESDDNGKVSFEGSGNEGASSERDDFEEYDSESETEGILYPVMPITNDHTDDFVASQAKFAVELFKKTVEQRKNNDSILISPLSVTLALAMTANGADGESLKELKALFGMPIDKLNDELCGFVEGIPSSEDAKLHIANSIWFRNSASLFIKEDFINVNKRYYNAEIRKRPFDATTVDEINDWVSENTDGMIKELLNDIGPSIMLYLINAIVFDAKWEVQYNEYNIQESEFTDIYGNDTAVNMMYSSESRYINDTNAQGFIKRYCEGYSFVALLPNEDISVYDYIAGLDSNKLFSIVKNARFATVHARLPKFRHEYSVDMSSMLSAMGVNSLFGPAAELGKMGECAGGNLAVSKVLHKTAIDLTAAGTRAAAVTSVYVYATSASPNAQEPIYITLDRPFVYMIIDNETSLPVFMGTVTEIPENNE